MAILIHVMLEPDLMIFCPYISGSVLDGNFYLYNNGSINWWKFCPYRSGSDPYQMAILIHIMLDPYLMIVLSIYLWIWIWSVLDGNFDPYNAGSISDDSCLFRSGSGSGSESDGNFYLYNAGSGSDDIFVHISLDLDLIRIRWLFWSI